MVPQPKWGAHAGPSLPYGTVQYQCRATYGRWKGGVSEFVVVVVVVRGSHDNRRRLGYAAQFPAPPPVDRQVSLPAGRRRLTVPSGVPAAACQSLLQGRARSAAYARSSCGGRIFFPSRVAWRHAGRRFGLVTRAVTSAVARELASRILFSGSDDTPFSFSVAGQWLQR